MSGPGIILQARMGSTRLPGKVLRPLAGKPMIQWIVERLSSCRCAGPLVVATGNGGDNDGLADFVSGLGIPVFRGSEQDVLDRYRACARQFGFDWVVRATGDNPFVDAEECDRLAVHARERGLDYATGFPAFGAGLPIGVGVEIMSRDALERSWCEGTAPHHREHVNEYIQEHPELFRQDTPPASPAKRAPGLSLTVDTPADFARAEALMTEWNRRGLGGHPDTAWLIAAAARLDDAKGDELP